MKDLLANLFALLFVLILFALAFSWQILQYEECMKKTDFGWFYCIQHAF